MNRRTAQDTWTARLLLAACFFASIAPAPAAELESAGPSSEFSGKLLGTDGRAAGGAEILAYHLATAELISATTDAKGKFTILDVPYGYYDMAVRSGDELYVADQVANVSATGKTVVELHLQPFTKATRADLRSFPGAEIAPVGLAHVIDPQMGPSFWRSPWGISTLAGGGAIALILLNGGSDPPASPFIP